MLKNQTRKGFALGALAALVVSSFTALPANAAGLDQGYVSLTPKDGDEYVVLAGAGNTFTLTANEASTLTVGSLKFLVTDTSGVIEPTFGTDGRIAHYLTTADTISGVVSSSDTVTLDSGETPKVAVGDLVSFTANVGSASGAVVASASSQATPLAYGITAIGTSTFSFVTDNPYVTGLTADITTARALYQSANVQVLREARNTTDKTYVVDTGVNSSATASSLVLKSDSETTREVTVVAWVDANNNDKIDSTEYVSPTRTVKFIKSTEVAPVITPDTLLVGDSTLSATITTNPVLNWDQMEDGQLEVDFTRQGSDATIGTDDSNLDATVVESFDADDREWTAAVSLVDTDLTSSWSNLSKPAALTLTSASGSISLSHVAQSGQNVTFTTTALHKLAVNDMITVTNNYTTTGSVKVTAVTDYSFTYESNVAATESAKAAIPGTTNPSVAVNKYGFAKAGTYTVALKIGDATTAKIGSAVTVTAAAATAASVKNKATANDKVSATFGVAKGYTQSVVVVSTVKNADAVAVGAGIPVTITATETSVGAVTVNGTAVSGTKNISAVTDANGQVSITVTNASAATGETVQLSVYSQGAADTDTLTWEVATYSLRDVADVQSVAELNRAIVSGGSVKFDLEVRNQFGALLTGDARLKVVQAGTRYNSTTYITLDGGKVSYTLADSPVDVTDTTGTVVFTLQQKDTAGSWADSDGTSPRVAVTATSTDTQLNGETVNINVYSATNGIKVSANADGNASDLSAAATTIATAASDTRKGETAVDFSTTVDDKVTIVGKVADAITGVAQSGHLVTVTGPANVLFRAGQVSSFGSITLLAGSTYTVDAFSTVGQTDSVVTITVNGVSTTTKISFTGAAADTGSVLTVTTPATATPGSTFQVSAKLVDKYGNPVDTGSVIKVSYKGPGIIFGSLPVETDKYGELEFSVLLGANDSGTATVTVSYDQNADADFTDKTDLVVTKTVTVGEAEPEVNAVIGSFQGRWAVRVENAKGSTVTVKVGGKWYKYVSLNDNYTFSRKSKVGATVPVKVWVDGLLQNDQTITIK